MSKITREEAIKKIDWFYTTLLGLKKEGQITNETYSKWALKLITVQDFINQQPQLSDDVEEDIELLKENYEFLQLSKNNSLMLNMGRVGLKTVVKLEQHIQAQASEIEHHKEFGLTHYKENIELKAQLNAIREEILRLEKLPIGKLGYLVIEQIKKILGELPTVHSTTAQGE